MANLYDLKKFDLNLLVIFECIYQHLSISKAAETLFITPSAVSQSLQRLRTQLNDPLFIRSGKGIAPTTMGINLHQHLENNLNSLEQTINIMHESSLKKKYILYTQNLSGPFFTMELINLILQDSEVEIEHYDVLVNQESVEDLLTYRKADIIVSTTAVNNRSIVCLPFAQIKGILVCRQHHPRINENSGIDKILQEQFTLLNTIDVGVKEFQSKIDAGPLTDRKIGFYTNSLNSIVHTIAGTDMIGFLPEIIFEYYKDMLKLKKLPSFFSIPTIPLYLMYNRASLNNIGFARLIEKVEKNSQ